jgi:hypothetical protein
MLKAQLAIHVKRTDIVIIDSNEQLWGALSPGMFYNAHGQSLADAKSTIPPPDYQGKKPAARPGGMCF